MISSLGFSETKVYPHYAEVVHFFGKRVENLGQALKKARGIRQ